jgi:hypothetical protein
MLEHRPTREILGRFAPDHSLGYPFVGITLLTAYRDLFVGKCTTMISQRDPEARFRPEEIRTISIECQWLVRAVIKWDYLHKVPHIIPIGKRLGSFSLFYSANSCKFPDGELIIHRAVERLTLLPRTHQVLEQLKHIEEGP